MSNIIHFTNVGKGLHSYTPELGECKPIAQIEARLGHYGTHYYIDTPLELKGRGISHLRQYNVNDLAPAGHYKIGWNQYKVTQTAFERLRGMHSISMCALLD